MNWGRRMWQALRTRLWRAQPPLVLPPDALLTDRERAAVEQRVAQEHAALAGLEREVIDLAAEVTRRARAEQVARADFERWRREHGR